MFSDFVVLQDGQLSNSIQNETLSTPSKGSGAALPARAASNPSHQVFSFCLNVTIDRSASIAADSVHCCLPLIFKCSFFLSRSELKTNEIKNEGWDPLRKATAHAHRSPILRPALGLSHGDEFLVAETGLIGHLLPAERQFR